MNSMAWKLDFGGITRIVVLILLFYFTKLLVEHNLLSGNALCGMLILWIVCIIATTGFYIERGDLINE